MTYPAAAVPLWAVLAINIVVSLAVAFLMPLPQMPGQGASQPPSPNNALAQRTNRQRLGGRIPDIYGTIKALPDLLSNPYTFYKDSTQIEFACMCVGRGYFDITQAYDDATPLQQVNEALALIYEPGKTILGANPQKQFGITTDIDLDFLNMSAKRYTAVNGQMISPSDNLMGGEIQLIAPNIVRAMDNSIDFTKMFQTGGQIGIANADNLASANLKRDANNNALFYNLVGVYYTLLVTKSEITLNDPASVNPSWQLLADNNDATEPTTLVISVDAKDPNAGWLGWFYTSNTDHDNVMINLKALNGLYQQIGEMWAPIGIAFEIESELIDSQYNTVDGTSSLKTIMMYSKNYKEHIKSIDSNNVITWDKTTDDKVRETSALSVFIDNPYFDVGKRMRWRIRRKTKRLSRKKIQYVQDVKLADFYGVRHVKNDEVPNFITLAYTQTVATESALAVKERKLQLDVRRYLRDWQNNDTLILTNRIDDIIYNIATDPIIGGLTINDLNMPQIKAEIDSVIDYFGTHLCAEFCGTFDNTDVTCEEMIQTVAQAGFCQAYRINNKIHLHFERPTDYPVVQFNAHNMLPDSYDMSESLGSRNNYDGVRVTYTDPSDEARVTLDYPFDSSATNPQKVELVGVRNRVQAHMHMMRTHWKNQLANKSCELVGADESGIVIPTNRIDVADIYNADVQQGVVESMGVTNNGQTVLQLSHPIDLASGQQATVFVQTMSGIVDNIYCQIGSHNREIVLSRSPVQPLSLAWDAVVRATYRLVTHSDFDRDSYLVTSKEPASNPLSHKLTCINYDSRYYQNDKDYINNLVTINPNP